MTAVPVPDVTAEIVDTLPMLRTYAFRFCGNAAGADDLVQETVLLALANIGLFEPGSDLRRWLWTIMRNAFYSAWRKRRREIQDEDGAHAASLAQRPAQEGHIRLLEIDTALGRLIPIYRQALMLVAVSGLSYDAAASIAGCPAGTMKSRVSRAREALTASA